MIFLRGWLNRIIGIALLFIGVGMLIATLFACGWFMIVISVVLIIAGCCLMCC